MSAPKISQLNLSVFLSKFIVKPFAAGLYGFASFFLIIIISKYLGTVIGSVASFKVDISDVQLSFLGFFFVFLINVLKNVQETKTAINKLKATE